jgi:hypothetical protein
MRRALFALPGRSSRCSRCSISSDNVSLDEANEQTALRYLRDVTGTAVAPALERIAP